LLSTAAITRAAPIASLSVRANSTSTAPSLNSDEPQSPRDVSHEREVVAGAHRCVEIDDLHLLEALEAAHPLLHVGVADGEALALHELHDGAVFEIDRWNQHPIYRLAVFFFSKYAARSASISRASTRPGASPW
jgi:hypothetical protein